MIRQDWQTPGDLWTLRGCRPEQQTVEIDGSLTKPGKTLCCQWKNRKLLKGVGSEENACFLQAVEMGAIQFYLNMHKRREYWCKAHNVEEVQENEESGKLLWLKYVVSSQYGGKKSLAKTLLTQCILLPCSCSYYDIIVISEGTLGSK